MQVRLENVTKKFPGVTAVNTFSVTLPDGELICLLGPSGCGKSTILNMLSGILPVSGGDIYFDEDNVTKLPPEERGEFLSELGIPESGLSRLIKLSYRLLGLISYLTAGPKEVRAWTIENGTKAPQAAGKIHTDFERGFIRAECVSYDELMACGSMAAAKEKGLVRSEGRDYVMRDGDVVLYRFNV